METFSSTLQTLSPCPRGLRAISQRLAGILRAPLLALALLSPLATASGRPEEPSAPQDHPQIPHPPGYAITNSIHKASDQIAIYCSQSEDPTDCGNYKVHYLKGDYTQVEYDRRGGGSGNEGLIRFMLDNIRSKQGKLLLQETGTENGDLYFWLPPKYWVAFSTFDRGANYRVSVIENSGANPMPGNTSETCASPPSTTAAPGNPNAKLTQVTVTKAEVTAGATVNVVLLFDGFLTQDATISMQSSQPGSAPVEPSITAPKGGKAGAFALKTSPSSPETTVTLTAQCDGITQSTTFRIQSAAPQAKLDQFWIAQTSLVGGGSCQAIPHFDKPLERAAVVQLQSSDPSLIALPPTVMAKKGERGASLTLKSKPVSSETSVTLTATHNGISQSQRITLKSSASSRSEVTQPSTTAAPASTQSAPSEPAPATAETRPATPHRAKEPASLSPSSKRQREKTFAEPHTAGRSATDPATPPTPSPEAATHIHAQSVAQTVDPATVVAPDPSNMTPQQQLAWASATQPRQAPQPPKMVTQLLSYHDAARQGATSRFNTDLPGGATSGIDGINFSRSENNGTIIFKADGGVVVGLQANPTLFRDFRLKNGWKVKSVVAREYITAPSEAGWSWVKQPVVGSDDPYLQLHLWATARDSVELQLEVTIEGPEGQDPYK